MSKERYINLSDRQVKDTQNQSQDFMSINTICRRLNQQDRRIEELLKANDSFGMIGNIIMEHYGKKDLCSKDVEDYANHIKEQDHKIAVLERALELAVADKCKYENLMVEGIVGKGAKVAVPKKEQWYKEQAESEIKNDKEWVWKLIIDKDMKNT